MRHSLQSRFRGALVGAALGEIWGFQSQFPSANRSLFFWQYPAVKPWFAEGSLKPVEAKPQLGYGQLVVEGVRQLIEHHRWDVESWDGENWNGETTDRTAPKDSFFGMIAALPISLYFHADLAQLRDQLRQAIAVWHPAIEGGEQQATYLISAYAIALALQEQLKPSHLIADLIADLELAKHSQGVMLLEMVTRWVDQDAGVSTVAQAVSQALKPLSHPQPKASCTPSAEVAAKISTAIALWSFLNTPDDFRLSVLQASRLRHYPQLTCALVGAISGAYNGLSGLPLDWRCTLHQHTGSTSALTILWNVTSEEVMLRLADQLVAAWAGIDNPSVFETASNTANRHPLAIAAPNVIRSR